METLNELVIQVSIENFAKNLVAHRDICFCTDIYWLKHRNLCSNQSCAETAYLVL